MTYFQNFIILTKPEFGSVFNKSPKLLPYISEKVFSYFINSQSFYKEKRRLSLIPPMSPPICLSGHKRSG